MTKPSHTGIGLALSGGVVRGIAHIGVIEALENAGVPISSISGASSGAVIGALYAAGMRIPEIKKIVLKTKWKNIFRLGIPRMGLISSKGIYAFMEKHLPVKKFSGLSIPFCAVATDLRTGQRVSITEGSVAKAVQASCSLPLLFTPTEINKKLLIDGGASSQIPVRAVREDLGAGVVAAVDVNYNADQCERLDNMLKIAAHLSILWASKNAREEERLADLVIAVNAKGISLNDFSKAEELLRRGKTAAEEKIPDIIRLLREPPS